MRAILVGPARDRALLRARINAAFDIVAEFTTLADARASGQHADAFVVTANGVDAQTKLVFTADEDVQLAEPLTARESQVLELLAEGLSNKGIASALGISDQTVKFHVASISGKLGAVNRTDAVRRAVRRGLVSL